MVRPVSVLPFVICVCAAVAHASGSARVMGMYPASSPTAAALPMLDSKFEVTVRGPIVETVVTQRFHNRTDRATEAIYIFPLPADAAVSAMSITTGTRTIQAAIEARAAAQRRYEAAVRAGVSAAVLDQERPDVFTQTVAVIPPKATVEVVLRYDAVARYSDGTWTHALPMVVAPRYVPGTASGRPTTGTGRSPDTDRVTDASRVTPHARPQGGGKTIVAITFDDGVSDVQSPTHDLTGKGRAYAFTDPHSDHDAVIRWRSSSRSVGWVEAGPGGGYAAVLVEAPPAPRRKGPARAMIVLDHAATMRGDATIVVQPLITALLSGLTGSDRVAVIGSRRVPWSRPADALRLLEQHRGYAAAPFDLTRVLREARPDGAPLLLITDGLVADDRAAIAAAAKLAVPIHVIGVGAAPARGLLSRIAATTGGTLRYAIAGDDLSAYATATITDLTTPTPPLTVTWGTLAARDVVPGVLPRLGAGQAILVLARVGRPHAANARARGELFAIETTASRPVAGATTAAGPLARRWAQAKLDELLVGTPNVAAVTAHALKFGLVSPYTSLVAIGTEVIVKGGVRHSVPVPVSVPAGMTWSAVKREMEVETTFRLGDAEQAPLDNNQTGSTPSGGTAGTGAATQTAQPTTGSTTGPTRPKPVKTTTKLKKPARQQAKPTDRKPRPTRAPPVVQERQKKVAGAPSPDAVQPTAPPPPMAEPAEDEDVDHDDDGEASGADDVAALDAPASRSAEADYGAELSMVEAASYRRALRISASLGGGLAITDTSRGLIALGARLELGHRTLLGAEASLWLVDGLHGQGRVLFTFARRGLARWLELGGGAGTHVGGTGVGPAATLGMRLRLPPAPAGAVYLRYDAALLFKAGDRQAQSALTLGLEWAF